MEVAQRVDAKPVDVPPGNYVLVHLDQSPLEVSILGTHLLERNEVAERVGHARAGNSLPAKERVPLELKRPDQRVSRRILDGSDVLVARASTPSFPPVT